MCSVCTPKQLPLLASAGDLHHPSAKEDAPPMPTVDDVRRLSLALPGAHEVTDAGDFPGAAWFNVGKKTFALVREGRVILKLDKAHQELLFESRPDVFQPCKVATGHWSYVDLQALADDELEAFVKEAWAQVAPKKVSRAL